MHHDGKEDSELYGFTGDRPGEQREEGKAHYQDLLLIVQVILRQHSAKL